MINYIVQRFLLLSLTLFAMNFVILNLAPGDPITGRNMSSTGEESHSMIHYIVQRPLLPLTLFTIILVNFVILNLAPGDPITARTCRTQVKEP